MQTPIENASLLTSVLLATCLVLVFAGLGLALFAIRTGALELGEIGDVAFFLLLLGFGGACGVGTWVVRSD